MRIPSWLVDVLIAAGLALVAVVIERGTEGRIASATVALWTGGGIFVLLRVGAILARAGRTLGCGFGFLVVLLLPCIGLLALVTSDEVERVTRDSLPLFLVAGAFLLVVMGVTLERVRVYDTARLAAAAEEVER